MEKLGDTIQDFSEFEAVKGEAPMRGRMVVLPSTYVGIDRYIRQKRLDIFSLALELGHPDIFMTMTRNLK